LANRIVELLGKAKEDEGFYLGTSLAALAPQLKGDQPDRGADRIVELLGKATENEASDLGRALPARTLGQPIPAVNRFFGIDTPLLDG
jgi:hypothetical protein